MPMTVFVLDTSVLLSDPGAVARFAEHDVVLVSKDLPLRVKAGAIGLAAQEYRAELAVSSGWTGMAEL